MNTKAVKILAMILMIVGIIASIGSENPAWMVVCLVGFLLAVGARIKET